MRMIETMIRLATSGAAAFALIAGLVLAPAPAQAQICGEFDEIAEDLLDVYIDTFGDLLGLSEKSCDSMTSTFYKACTTAVKDAAKCYQRQSSTLPKAAKPACAENSKNPSDCNDYYKESAKTDKDQIESAADEAIDDCEFAADYFFDYCRFPTPP